jgi:hypothetical protein
MDTRNLIEMTLDNNSKFIATEQLARIQKLDNDINSNTIEIKECIWG